MALNQNQPDFMGSCASTDAFEAALRAAFEASDECAAGEEWRRALLEIHHTPDDHRWGCRYPDSPCLVDNVAELLVQWRDTGHYPLPLLWKEYEDHFEIEKDACQELMDNMSALLLKPNSLKDTQALVEHVLTPRVLMALLGFQWTVGTVPVPPPALMDLVTSANRMLEKNGVPTQQTACARALAKHGPRASDGWWGGEPKGSMEKKNEQAEGVVHRILREGEWLNLHSLPHGITVVEVRVREGYGCRWHVDAERDVTFRGFLEPPDPNGHDKGWNH